jgi:hypothetical protein
MSARKRASAATSPVPAAAEKSIKTAAAKTPDATRAFRVFRGDVVEKHLIFFRFAIDIVLDRRYNIDSELAV